MANESVFEMSQTRGISPLRNYAACVCLIVVALVIVDRARGFDGSRPVFIHASCESKTSATLLSSLKDQLSMSQKYAVVPAVDDNGRMDVVLEIYMDCEEHNDVVAIATTYGKGKCLSLHQCGSMIDGSSIKSTLCEVGAISQCGKILFTSFDKYVEHSSAGRQAPVPPASK
jgi:hypothetical protein